MNPPSVAAIIPTRNRQDKTLRFLEGLFQQTYANLNAIVVDSNSSDGTPEAIVKKHAEAKVLSASDHDYWANATNIGVCFAMDQGYDFILTINDDSVIERNYVEKLVAIALRHNLSILGSRINYLSDPGLIWSLGVFANWGSANFLTLFCNRERVENLPADMLARDHLRVDALPGNGVLVHRSVYEKIGTYNTTFTPHYHADSELTLRATANNIQVFVAPNISILNDFSEDQKRVNLKSFKGVLFAFFHKKSYLFVWAWLYLFFKYCPTSKKIATLWSSSKRLSRINVIQ